MKTPNEASRSSAVDATQLRCLTGFYHFELYGKLIQRRINGNWTCHSGLYQAVGYEFLIHFRALLDFFFAAGGKDDDLLGSDFCILHQVLPASFSGSECPGMGQTSVRAA